jgi:hypothetical protein
MLNFFLAIVVEAYMAVRSDLEANEISSDFVTDVIIAFRHSALAFAVGWPSRREVANLLRFKIIKKSVSARILRITSGLPGEVARSITETYFQIEYLRAEEKKDRMALKEILRSVKKKQLVTSMKQRLVGSIRSKIHPEDVDGVTDGAQKSVKQSVADFFKSLDTDGSGTVSKLELKNEFLVKAGVPADEIDATAEQV